MIEKVLINSFFVIPAQAGIQSPVFRKPLDSGARPYVPDRVYLAHPWARTLCFARLVPVLWVNDEINQSVLRISLR